MQHVPRIWLINPHAERIRGNHDGDVAFPPTFLLLEPFLRGKPCMIMERIEP